MSERIIISDISELTNDITKTFCSDAVCSDMLISSYKTVCGDPDLSENEKTYYDDALGGTLKLLDAVRNPQIFNADIKRAVTLFFCPSSDAVPSALKDGYAEKEDEFYKRMAVLCPDIFKDGTHFEKLTRLYDSGCPCRMTEVYTDPFTAIYKAIKNGDTQMRVFAVPTDEISYPESDKTLLLSCLPKLPFSKKRELLETAYSSLLTKRFQQLKGGSRYLEDAPEELYKEITTEKPFFRRDINPADLLKPLFTAPYVRQDKAYIISGLCADEKDAYRRADAITVRTYVFSDVQKLLSELSLLGFGGERFFDCAKGAAEYLKNNVF